MKIFLSTMMIAGVMILFGTAAYAQNKKIGMKRAQEIASTKAPGLRLKAKELEHEKGAWIYSFEFKNKDGSIREVNVNAYTGSIVGVERENAKKETNEERNEKKGKN
ncbi:MAG: PepSY domain-containing protein [Acidobacteriota bacterium]